MSIDQTLLWLIYATDRDDINKRSLIGACFNKGLAEIWVESWANCTLRHSFIIVRRDTKQTFHYKNKQWVEIREGQ